MESLGEYTKKNILRLKIGDNKLSLRIGLMETGSLLFLNLFFASKTNLNDEHSNTIHLFVYEYKKIYVLKEFLKGVKCF